MLYRKQQTEMTPTQDYLNKCRHILEVVGAQEAEILHAAQLFTQTILAGRMVHVFGSGHSRIMVEEMWPRYGSFPGFNPIVELSLTFHNLVVGANGQRQAMFLENTPGLAERILRNFDLSTSDTALIISSSGCNVVPIEMAEQFQRKKSKWFRSSRKNIPRRARASGPTEKNWETFLISFSIPALRRVMRWYMWKD